MAFDAYFMTAVLEEIRQRCLEFIRTKPFGDSNRVALTCHEGNSAALGLYASLGFLPTGQRDDEEIELALELTT